jgi:hypothetical protein
VVLLIRAEINSESTEVLGCTVEGLHGQAERCSRMSQPVRSVSSNTRMEDKDGETKTDFSIFHHPSSIFVFLYHAAMTWPAR